MYFYIISILNLFIFLFSNFELCLVQGRKVTAGIRNFQITYMCVCKYVCNEYIVVHSWL